MVIDRLWSIDHVCTVDFNFMEHIYTFNTRYFITLGDKRHNYANHSTDIGFGDLHLFTHDDWTPIAQAVAWQFAEYIHP